MRVEYNGTVAFPETVEEAAALMRLLANSNGRKQVPALPAQSPRQPVEQAGKTNGDEPPNVATVLRGLREPQKALFTTLLGNNGSMSGPALMEVLKIQKQGLGGLLVGIRHALKLAGINPEHVLRTHETDSGKIYMIPSRYEAAVQEALGM